MQSDVNVRRWLPILVLIVLVALGLRVKYAVGFMPIDDAEYARVAYQISHRTFTWGAYPGPPVVPVRSGIVLPTAVMFSGFGPTEWAMAAYPLLLSTVLLLVIFALTSRIFGYYAGLIAAGLWAFVPFERLMATSLRPDLPSTAFAFVGIFAIYVTRERVDLDRTRSLLGGAAAGLAFGLGWLCKESIVYFAPFCLILICHDLYRYGSRYAAVWAGVAAGSLTVLGGEMLFYALQTGDGLYRFHATEADYVKYPELFFAQGSRFGFDEGSGYWKALAKRLFLGGPETIFLTAEFLYLPFFALIAAAYGLYWKDRRFAFVTLLLVTLTVMFNFASVSFHTYQPLPLFPRYFYTICVPATILTAGLLSTLFLSSAGRSAVDRREAAFWGGLLATSLFMITAYSAFRLVRDAQPTWASAERTLATVIRPGDAVYTDPLTRNGLEFFWGYPTTMRINDVHMMPDGATLPCGSFVLINASYVNWLQVNHGTWLTLDGFRPPQFFKQPPGEWEKVWSDQNAQLYRVPCDGVQASAQATGGR